MQLIFIPISILMDVILIQKAYKIHFWYMSKDDAINIMTNSNINQLINAKSTRIKH